MSTKVLLAAVTVIGITVYALLSTQLACYGSTKGRRYMIKITGRGIIIIN